MPALHRSVHLLPVVAGLALAGLCAPAHAGWNGQQISFRTPGAQLASVQISGDNQFDRRIVWDSARFRVICHGERCDEVRTRRWWFKGKVTIEYRLRGDRRRYACHYYINERQAGNWVTVTAPSSHTAARWFRKDSSRPEARCNESGLMTQ